jgi:signal transduction histidine kinase
MIRSARNLEITAAAHAREPVRRWMKHLPLVTGVLLAALLVVPLWLRSHTEHLRVRVTDVALPARNSLLEVQSAFASELAAIRGFELTGDTAFLADFRAGIVKDRDATRRLLLLAPQLGPRAEAAVAELDARKAAWLEEPKEALAGRRTRDELVRSLSDGERHVDGVLAAADKANAAVVDAEATMRQTVSDDEQSASALVLLLGLAALIVIIVVGWLVHRLSLLTVQLQHSVSYRDDMLRVVSHDLKNPLHTIGMIADLLSTVPLPDAERDSQLRIVTRTVERMNRLIHDLLDSARVESGNTLVVSPASLDTRDLLHDVDEQLGTEPRAKNIRLICDPDGAPKTIIADRDRLLQVFANLIGNATKFTPEGGLITVRAGKAAGAAVRFAVEDSGTGIAAEHLPHLFEPFWQARDRASLGTGLGLSIARGIVEAHGGRFSVRSTPGEGTTFSFTLPSTPVVSTLPPSESRVEMQSR